MNEFGLSDADLLFIISEIKKFPEVERAMIFGSRAKGNFKNGSDVDIALFGTTVSFGVSSSISAVLNERSLLPYHFDILGFEQIEDDDVKEHILRVGKIIYQK